MIRLDHENLVDVTEGDVARLVERWREQSQQLRQESAVSAVVHLSAKQIKLEWRHEIGYNAARQWINPKLARAGYEPAICRVRLFTGCSAPQAAQQGLPSKGHPAQPRNGQRKEKVFRPGSRTAAATAAK